MRPLIVYRSQAPGYFKRLLELISAGIPLSLRSINNKRSIVPLENIVNFLKICRNSKEEANKIFLIAAGDDLSISQLIDFINFGRGKKTCLFLLYPKFLAKITSRAYFYLQIAASLQIDTSKSKSLLSWTPPIASDEAIIWTGRKYAFKKIV